MGMRSRMSMSTLVVAEQEDGVLSGATLNTISAAQKFESPVTAVVGGSNAAKAAEELASVSGVSRVLVSEAAHLDHGLAEEWAPFLAKVQGAENFERILGNASSTGKSVLPRFAALLDVSPISEIIEVVDSSTFVRPIYAGNALATVRSNDSVKVLSVRSTAFDAAEVGAGGRAASVEQFDAGAAAAGDSAKWVGREVTKSERPDLTSAATVVSGGRALKSEENFSIIYQLADKLGAAVGASRAAVDAGYCPNDMQVGQTGKIVAPQLYIAIGISGAIQHLAGCKDSKTIVAINKDEDAPIFGVADYGLVADLFDAVPALEAELAK
jgi:electron transfer flavoprotein alpha subunit